MRDPAPPWNDGPNVLSTSLVSPGLSVVIPMGLSVAVGVGELKRSPYAAISWLCLPVLSAKIFSPSYNPRKTVLSLSVLDERLVLWLNQV